MSDVRLFCHDKEETITCTRHHLVHISAELIVSQQVIIPAGIAGVENTWM
jgi:hypothetical protein